MKFMDKRVDFYSNHYYKTSVMMQLPDDRYIDREKFEYIDPYPPQSILEQR